MSMERFTKKVDGVWTALCNYGSSPCPVVTQEIIDRLAAYEDTGLAPEEVQQMRWIPVEERLPEESDGMVLFTNGKAVTSGYRNHMFRMSGEEGIYAPAIRKGGGYMRVTHWMPLPEPPKEGTNGKH